MFPKSSTAVKNESPAIALFGNRFLTDQTLIEYLVEFLLVFCSAKNEDGSAEMSFHEQGDSDQPLRYYVKPRIALRRFIFYRRSKQDSRSTMDDEADRYLMERLGALADMGDIAIIQDLLGSFGAVIKKRGWYAKALLPIAPELVLTDVQGIRARQRGIASTEGKPNPVDEGFDFDKHNFLARGGQLYYLHILEGFSNDPALSEQYRTRLEKLLVNLVSTDSHSISMLANFVQYTWDEHCAIVTPSLKKFNMGYLQPGYAIRAKRSIEELVTFLSSSLHPIARIELLSQGVVLTLLRCMHLVADQKVNGNTYEPVWIIDMRAGKANSNVARLSMTSYQHVYETIQTALSLTCDEIGYDDAERFKKYNNAKKNTADVFKRLGKEIKLIIPARGDYERFSLSEGLVRYLVLALLPPKSKCTFDSFLNKLYRNYRMVIGPEQYREAIRCGRHRDNADMANYFSENATQFQEFLKRCGFLRDLSDATSIVENPYEEVKLS